MKKEAANWLESAQYDLGTAENMLEAGRYIYAVFMCHLSLEKALKAIVQEVSDRVPPKTHDLEYLLTLAGLKPDKEAEQFAAELSNLSVLTRYPIDFRRTKRDFSEERAKAILEGTKGFTHG
jgi:HEPN domain-containing protein